MTQQPAWRRYLRFWGPNPRADVEDELSFHVKMLEEEYGAAGLSEEEARRAAQRRFGDALSVQQECLHIGEESERMIRRREIWSTLLQDLRFGLRQLRANPLISFIAVLTLALGIGANTAIFSVVNGVLLRPLPYRDADRLMVSGMSFPDFRYFQERARSFDGMAVWASNLFTIRSGDEPEEIRGGIVSAEFFALLADPVNGRAIDAENERTQVAVISHALWQRRFAGERSVLGQTIDLSGRSHTIIGVMPPTFRYPDSSFDVWVPMITAMTASPGQMENRSLRIFRVVAHLRPSATAEQVTSEARTISEELTRLYPSTNNGVTYDFVTMSDLIVGSIRSALWVMLAVVGLVLLIACGNVANLLLGLSAARSREFAVRLALGAGKGRLVRQLVTESVVLAMLGGVLGVLLARYLVILLPRLTDDLPRLMEITLDARVLGFALIASLLTALLFGLAPALQGAGGDLNEVLKEGGRSGIGSRRGGMLRSTLVAGEVALALIVLIGASLFLRSLMRVVNQDIGFQPEQLISANVGLFYFQEPARRAQMLQQALERVGAVPGVGGVAAGSGLPPQSAQRGTGFSVAGRAPDEAEQNGASWIGITPGYFATLGTRIVRGREFNDTDTEAAAPVAIINATLARSLFGDTNPIGRQVQLTNPDAGDAWRTIVGVVDDIRYSGVENAGVAALYTPFAQAPFTWAYLMVRSAVPADRLTRPLRQAIAGIDPRMVPARVQQHTNLIDDLIATRSFLTWLLAAFALLALILASVGIYGVISFNVAQRRREIGVRLALGARPRVVVTQVVLQALKLVAIGAVVGMAAALWLTRLLTTMLYNMRPTDPATYMLGAVLITAIGFTAASLPALRASRVDPTLVLRE